MKEKLDLALETLEKYANLKPDWFQIKEVNEHYKKKITGREKVTKKIYWIPIEDVDPNVLCVSVGALARQTLEQIKKMEK